MNLEWTHKREKYDGRIKTKKQKQKQKAVIVIYLLHCKFGISLYVAYYVVYLHSTLPLQVLKCNKYYGIVARFEMMMIIKRSVFPIAFPVPATMPRYLLG
jgi:hypothetical protein